MRDSRGEIKIYEILTENGVNFEEEYVFPDLVTTNGKPLRFDFAILDDDGNLEFLIEYQGIQHYEAKSIFGGRTGLVRQKHNDNMKRDYCRKHGYKLVEIPYTHEQYIDYDYIMRAAYDA